MASPQARHSAGSRDGGRYAATDHGEGDCRISAPVPPYSDSDLTDWAGQVAAMYSPDGEGLCLVTSAALAVAMQNQHPDGSPIEAVRGEVEGEAHWWIERDGRRFDPTRAQFGDGGPVVTDASDEGGWYVEQERFPAGWTVEHVFLEGHRAFAFPQASDEYVAHLLEVLGVDWEVDLGEAMDAGPSWVPTSRGHAHES